MTIQLSLLYIALAVYGGRLCYVLCTHDVHWRTQLRALLIGAIAGTGVTLLVTVSGSVPVLSVAPALALLAGGWELRSRLGSITDLIGSFALAVVITAFWLNL